MFQYAIITLDGTKIHKKTGMNRVNNERKGINIKKSKGMHHFSCDASLL